MSEATTLTAAPAAPVAPATAPPAAPGPTSQAVGPPPPTDAAGACNAQPGPVSAGGADGAQSPQSSEAEQPKAPKPVEYALKLPDGIQAQGALERFTALAREAQLAPDAAQKVVDTFAEALKEDAERTASSWTQALKADKELGGAELDARGQVARRALVKYGTPELTSFLNETGLGNHPELVRVFYRIGQALSEDSVAGTSGTGAAASPTSDEALLRALYPTMTQKQA